MITYNPAFDLYHCIYRMAHILQRLDAEETMEVDKARIWDFYLLFPSKLYKVHLKSTENNIRELRKQVISKDINPYDYNGDNRKLFENIQPYQMTALNCLIACGILDKEHFSHKELYVVNRDLLDKLISDTGKLTCTEFNVLSFLSYFSKHMPMLGVNGLKARTELMESKYDAE